MPLAESKNISSRRDREDRRENKEDWLLYFGLRVLSDLCERHHWLLPKAVSCFACNLRPCFFQEVDEDRSEIKG